MTCLVNVNKYFSLLVFNFFKLVYCSFPTPYNHNIIDFTIFTHFTNRLQYYSNGPRKNQLPRLMSELQLLLSSKELFLPVFKGSDRCTSSSSCGLMQCYTVIYVNDYVVEKGLTVDFSVVYNLSHILTYFRLVLMCLQAFDFQ